MSFLTHQMVRTGRARLYRFDQRIHGLANLIEASALAAANKRVASFLDNVEGHARAKVEEIILEARLETAIDLSVSKLNSQVVTLFEGGDLTT